MGAFPTMLNQTFTVSVSKCVLHFLDGDFVIWYHILSHSIITVLMGKMEQKTKAR